ncbi:MAG: universal stress protein [Solirubrobacterales bacterium]|jgi:nucleotide-binding universal stress UspA family protein
MFERILLAVDGSEHSRKAVPVAGDLSRRYGGEVIVLHVREHEVTWGADIDVETADEARELVDGVVRELKDSGANVRGEVMRVALGQTPRAILDLARDEGVGLIVMGTRGLSDWGRLLMGSVAHKIVHLAEVPVLVVR